MQLVGPDIVARNRLRSARHGRLHITFINQLALGRWIGAQGLLEIVQIRQARPGLPVHTEFAHGLLGKRLVLGHNADEITDHHHRPNAGNMRDRRLVHRRQRVANEVAVVGTGIRRPDDTAMQHARHPHVMHKGQPASHLGGDVQTGRAGADNPVILGPLERRADIEQQRGMLTGQQGGVGD